MRTSKGFATISYNTDKFFYDTLNDCVRRGVLDFWVFIRHIPESDQGKSHIHAFFIPSALLDTKPFGDLFIEPDPNHPERPPFKCMTFESSKLKDWLLYSLHDEPYLLSKGIHREHHYNFDDLVTSDPTYLQEKYSCIDRTAFDRNARIISLAKSGVTADQMLYDNVIGLNQYQAVCALIRNIVYRDDRPNPVPRALLSDEEYQARFFADSLKNKSMEEK